MSRPEPTLVASARPPAWPDNPVLTRVWRAGQVESQHRGAWALVDTSGAVLDSRGDVRHPIFARSALKSLQALPLLESGAAEHFAFGDDEVALALASHNAEARHTERVQRILGRLSLDVGALQCGPQPPGDFEVCCELARAGAQPTSLHNNCSGKHAGFLTLARHLEVDPRRYLDPDCEVQVRVRAAVAEMAEVESVELGSGRDGCSAPTFRLPLTQLAMAIARVANPDGLAPGRRAACLRMLRAVGAHPELLAGTRKRLCSDLARVTGGRLFPKIGADGVYVIGAVGRDCGLAIKIDDGGERGLSALVVELCLRLGWIDAAQADALAEFRAGALTSWAGEEVGHIEVAP